MARWRLTLAYDGRPFDGWQSQRGGRTIQDIVERALGSVGGSSIRLHAAGRTDAGVHALAQSAHFDAPDQCRLVDGEWIPALNANLPATIRVIGCQRCAEDFHARFDACGKVYRYRLWHGDVLPPLEAGLAWHIAGVLDDAAIREAAGLFEGEHDFSAFSANRRGGRETSRGRVRRLHQVTVERAGNVVALTFRGDGFLYKMVRMITGAIVRVARRKMPIDVIVDLLAHPDQPKPGWQAPADGLYLVGVEY